MISAAASCRLAGHALLCAALGVLAPCIALGAEISPGDREAVFQGTGRACNEQIPEAIRQRAGADAVLNFCSCYANEVARSITEEQADALADWSVPPDAVPHYDETMLSAWRACERQLLTTGHDREFGALTDSGHSR